MGESLIEEMIEFLFRIMTTNINDSKLEYVGVLKKASSHQSLYTKLSFAGAKGILKSVVTHPEEYEITSNIASDISS
jgi:hypothetical protein